MTNSILKFLRSDDGPTAVEYAVLLALIVAVCLGSVTALATATGESFDNSSNSISSALSGS